MHPMRDRLEHRRLSRWKHRSIVEEHNKQLRNQRHVTGPRPDHDQA